MGCDPSLPSIYCVPTVLARRLSMMLSRHRGRRYCVPCSTYQGLSGKHVLQAQRKRRLLPRPSKTTSQSTQRSQICYKSRVHQPWVPFCSEYRQASCQQAQCCLKHHTDIPLWKPVCTCQSRLDFTNLSDQTLWRRPDSSWNSCVSVRRTVPGLGCPISVIERLATRLGVSSSLNPFRLYSFDLLDWSGRQRSAPEDLSYHSRPDLTWWSYISGHSLSKGQQMGATVVPSCLSI